MALKQLQAANPTLYDPMAVDTAALQAIGWNNPTQFFADASLQGQPPPEVLKAIEELKIKKQDADSRSAESQARVAETQAKISQGAFSPKPGLGGGPNQTDTPVDMMIAQNKLEETKLKHKDLQIRHKDVLLDDRNRDLDRESRERLKILELAKDSAENPASGKSLSKTIRQIKKDVQEA